MKKEDVIFDFLSKNNERKTVAEISNSTGIRESSVKKACCNLLESGKIIKDPETEEGYYISDSKGCAKKVNKREIYIAAAITLAFLLWGIMFINDYGVTWDEPDCIKPGLRYLEYFSTGKLVLDDLGYVKFYGPFAIILATASHKLLYGSMGLLGYWESFHLVNLLFAAATVFILYIFSSQVYGRGVALLTTLSLLTFPQFIGHAFNNVKDTPITTLFLMTIWAFYNYAVTGKKRWALLTGVFFGLAFDIKINAVFIIPILLLWLVLSYRDKLWPIVKTKRFIDAKPGEILTAFFLIIVASALTVYLFWPWLWDDPVNKIFSVVNHFKNSGALLGQLSVFYLGTGYTSSNVPWHYSFVYIAVVTPLAILIFSLIGIFVAGKHLLKLENRASGLFLVWMLISLSKQAIPGVSVYDGIRHFLEVTPALCVLSGLGGYWVYNAIRSLTKDAGKKKAYSLIAAALVLSPFAYSVYEIYRAHPYETSYFSPIVGGPAGAAKSFRVEYWEHVNKNGAVWINSKAPQNAGVVVIQGDFLAEYYFRPDIKSYKLDDVIVNNSLDVSKIDFIMSPRPINGAPLVHTENVMDFPIQYIYYIPHQAAS